MRTTGDILMAAVDQFDQHGWCTDTLKNDDGAMCAAGALSQVLMGKMTWDCWSTPEFRAAAVALAAHIPDDFPNIRDNAVARVVDYNNSRTDYSEIREWFIKSAMDEGVTL